MKMKPTQLQKTQKKIQIEKINRKH